MTWRVYWTRVKLMIASNGPRNFNLRPGINCNELYCSDRSKLDNCIRQPQELNLWPGILFWMVYVSPTAGGGGMWFLVRLYIGAIQKGLAPIEADTYFVNVFAIPEKSTGVLDPSPTLRVNPSLNTVMCYEMALLWKWTSVQIVIVDGGNIFLACD